MDRPKRAATKVTDFRRYHLSGDLNEQLTGRVDTRINQFEMTTSADELRQQLEAEREASNKLQQEAEMLHIQHELEAEKIKQKEWQVAMDQLHEAKEKREADHAKYLEQIKDLSTSTRQDAANTALEWFKGQMEALKGSEGPSREEQEQKRREAEEKQAAIMELQKQQETIAKQLAELTGETVKPPVGGVPTDDSNPTPSSSEHLLQQLRAALTGKQGEEPNKSLLRALSLPHNRAAGEGGTNTLKSNILSSILPGEGPSHTADWLANMNRQEEGEFKINRYALGEGDPNQRQGKVKSGILDRATSNIQQKQVWPQQNLGEDWADEEIKFCQLNSNIW